MTVEPTKDEDGEDLTGKDVTDKLLHLVPKNSKDEDGNGEEGEVTAEGANEPTDAVAKREGEDVAEKEGTDVASEA